MAKSKDEFSRISTYFAPLSAGYAGAFGLRDDAAVICPDEGCELVITTDTIVETIHFLGHENAADIAHKLIAVNFSDLASKGASPIAYSLNLSLPPCVSDQWIFEFCQELARQQEKFKCHLIGGDSVGLPQGAPITLSITAFGNIDKGRMLRRNTAKAGDLICVSGTIGDSALGLLVARGELGIDAGDRFLENRYYRPTARIACGLKMRDIATASMDISDGLIADLGHLAYASNLQAEINIADIPLSKSAIDIIATDPNLMELVLTGGDDYELLFTIAPNHAPMMKSLAKQSETTLSVIGTMREGASVKALDRDGNVISFVKTGFRHVR